jgi:hypothetical protein
MAENNHTMEGRLAHRKSENFINEYADRFSITNMMNGPNHFVTIAMGRDVVEVLDELISDTGLTPHKDGFEIYRRNVASVSIPIEAAEALANAILRQIKPAESGVGEAEDEQG